MFASSQVPEPLMVMGVPVSPFESYDHALACVEECVRARRKSFWVAINPQKIHRANHDPRVRAVLAKADAGLCDGVGVSIAAKMLLRRRLNRVTGCDLFFASVGLAAQRGWGVFFLGASPESNAGAAQRLTERFPGLRIVGRQDGYFADSADVVRRINESGAELLFVAMGSPKQEFWITEHRPALDCPFCMGVGGSFDVASGRARRAPRVMRRLGLEFLFQLLSQPSRWRRQIVYAPYMVSVIRRSLFSRGVRAG